MLKNVWNGFIATLCVGLGILTTWAIGTIMAIIGMVTLPLQFVIYSVWSSKTAAAKDFFGELLEKLDENEVEIEIN